MRELSAKSATRLALEGLVILVSILAAFFLEGWRDDRREMDELREELVSVELELRRNEALMTAHLAALNRIVNGGDALLAALQAGGTASTVAIPDTLAFLALGYNPSFDPSIGGVEALIASGRLAKVSDPELKLGLASLRDLMNDAAEEELNAREIQTLAVLPLLAPLFDAALYRDAQDDFFYSSAGSETGDGTAAIAQQERSLERPLRSYRIVEFPNSLEIRNTLNEKMAWFRSGQAEFGRLVVYMELLASRLSQSLD